jgi:hypothetical protein
LARDAFRPPSTGLARHPSYYRTVSASRSPTAKVPNDAAKSPSIDPSVGALVVILEDYLQLPAASSPLRHPPAQAALAHHFRRLLVGNLIDQTHSMRAVGARSFETLKEINALGEIVVLVSGCARRWRRGRCCLRAAGRPTSSSFSSAAPLTCSSRRT